MSEQLNPNRASGTPKDADTIKLVYLLYWAGFFIFLTTLVGVVVAYLKRGEVDEISATHLTFQIRTFWISILFLSAGIMLTIVLIGFLIIFAWLIWAIVRNVKGFMLISEGRPIAEPETWLW